MLEATLHPVELPLRHAWTIAHGTRTVQRNLIVALYDPDSGETGYGEAPAIPYMGVTIPQLIERVRWDDPRLRRAWEDAVFGADGSDEPGQAPTWQEMTLTRGVDANGRFIRAAMDMAVYDLWGKRRGRSTRSLWSQPGDPRPASDYTIGLADPEVMIAKLREFPGFPVYKIKLGHAAEAGGIEQDLAVLRRLREATDRPLRVDANTAWTAEQTIRVSEPLRDLGVEFIEQPLPPGAPRSEHEAAYFGSVLPIVADESCQVEEDVAACAGLFHGINIKLSKCGGITPARRMIDRARELSLRVMMGCMTETSVGISAIGQLLPRLDDVDMDGALLLAPGSDPAQGVRVGADGVAIYPQGEADRGNGVRVVGELPRG